MIVGVSVKNYKVIRSLRSLSLGRFHVLVGPNASGKSTFLDAIDFVRDCLAKGPLGAVEDRVPDLRDLTFMRRGGNIEIELWLDLGSQLEGQKDSLLQYRLVLRAHEAMGVCVDRESLQQYSKSWLPAGKPLEFSAKVKPKRLLGKTSKGSDFFQREVGTYQDSFVFGLDKLTLGATPPDEKRFPTANAVRRFLMQGIRYLQLNSRAMREPCAATRPTDLELDGTNLARVVGRLRGKHSGSQRNGGTLPHSEALDAWTEHLRFALEDLDEIGWGRREPDNAEYLILKYANSLECPSWLLSDGTLRMLALTLPAFLPANPAIYMVEEPENGVHPRALEVILRALTSITAGQVLVATHSPLVVQAVGREPLLCFSRTENGARIVRGNAHPLLKEWDGTPDLATVFASGVLA